MNVVNLNSASLNSKRLNVIGDIRSSAGGGGGGGDARLLPLYIDMLTPGTIGFKADSYEYSMDNKTWISAKNSDRISVSKGDRIYFRASGLVASAYKSIGNFFSDTESFGNVGGNVMSLVYGSDFQDKTELTQDYELQNLFYYSSLMVVDASALILPATTLTASCYYQMFQGCTSLVNAPELPATTLAESCYSHMFNSCTSLVNAPELPATTLARNCYDTMFASCTSLVNAPELPATTLAESCYFQMFYNCTSLESAPELPATTLARDCYKALFYDCSSLQYIKAMFLTTPGYSYTRNWVVNVPSGGIFVKNSAATWNVTGSNGIPEGWEVITE